MGGARPPGSKVGAQYGSRRTPQLPGARRRWEGCGAATGRRRSVITARAFAVMDGTSRNPPGPRHTTPAVVPPPARPPAFLGGGAPEGAALEAFKVSARGGGHGLGHAALAREEAGAQPQPRGLDPPRV